MKKYLVLFCFFVGKFMVTGNTLAQIIPTIQTCPHACNQNSYQNLNTYQIPNNYQNQASFNVPLLLQQNPQQIPVIQQNGVPTVYQQPNNNQLYPQQLIVQNQSPAPNNQVPNPVNQLSQMYMNKILSNPAIQGILDQNNNLMYQTTQGYPQKVNNCPNSVKTLDNTPTIVNNYFVLPPEILNIENDHVQPKSPNEPARNRDRPQRERQSHDRKFQKCNDCRRRPNPEVDMHANPEFERRPVKNPDCPIHSKKNQIRPDAFADRVEHPHSNEGWENVNRKRKQNGQNYEWHRERTSPDHPNPNRRGHPDRNIIDTGKHQEILRNHEMPRQHEVSKHHDQPRPNPQDKKVPNIIIKIKEVPKSSSEIRNSNENLRDVINKPQSSKKIRLSRDDEIIEEFKDKFPTIPEEVVRKLLSYLRRQLYNQQSGQKSFDNADISFPLRHDQLFPHSQEHNDRNNQRRRPNRRPNRKQQIDRNDFNSNVETTTTDDFISTIPTTTERTFIDVKINKNTDKEKKSDVLVTPKQSAETTTINNRIIDDYFPDFTKDNVYFDSGEVYNVRNLRDDRYHYTTDRNYEPKHSQHKHKNVYIDKGIDEYSGVIRKPIDIKTTTSKYEVETEVQYRTPPSLEFPDFETKQVLRHKTYSDKDVSYKASTYSEAKTPSKSDGKNYKSNNSKKSKTDNVPTVYAHSKVANYGKVDDINENVTPVVTYYLPDNMQFEEDGKTIVVAKRIPADHFW